MTVSSVLCFYPSIELLSSLTPHYAMVCSFVYLLVCLFACLRLIHRSFGKRRLHSRHLTGDPPFSSYDYIYPTIKVYVPSNFWLSFSRYDCISIADYRLQKYHLIMNYDKSSFYMGIISPPWGGGIP